MIPWVGAGQSQQRGPEPPSHNDLDVVDLRVQDRPPAWAAHLVFFIGDARPPRTWSQQLAAASRGSPRAPSRVRSVHVGAGVRWLGACAEPRAPRLRAGRDADHLAPHDRLETLRPGVAPRAPGSDRAGRATALICGARRSAVALSWPRGEAVAHVARGERLGVWRRSSGGLRWSAGLTPRRAGVRSRSSRPRSRASPSGSRSGSAVAEVHDALASSPARAEARGARFTSPSARTPQGSAVAAMLSPLTR